MTKNTCDTQNPDLTITLNTVNSPTSADNIYLKPSAWTKSLYTPTHQQVSTWLRDNICAGVFAVGTKLPTVRQLAERFSTSICTVQSAINPLVEDGLLERRHGVGIYVRQASIELKCLAVYYDRGLTRNNQNAYYWRLIDTIKEQLSALNVDLRLWGDSQENKLAGRPPAGLLEAVEQRQVQALIILARDIRSEIWINQLKLPLAIIASGQKPYHVMYQKNQFIDLALSELAQRGRRRLSVVTTINLPQQSEEASSFRRHFHEHLPEAAAQYGLEIRPEWIKTPLVAGDSFDVEQFAYTAFQQIWSSWELPDCLLVYPDIAARGVVVALSGLQVQIPRDLQVAFHCNAGIEIFAPFPYLAIESNPEQEIAMALDIIKQQLRGQLPEVKPLRLRTYEYIHL